jgi:hypothetical protein
LTVYIYIYYNILLFYSYDWGAIKGLAALGEKVIQIVIIPNISGYIKMLNLKKNSIGSILNLPAQFMLESAIVSDTLMVL